MDHVAEPLTTRVEMPHVARDQRDLRCIRELWRLPAKGFGVAGQHGNFAAQAEPPVGLEYRGEQPLADEPGSAGQKDALPTQAFPTPPDDTERVIEIRQGW